MPEIIFGAVPFVTIGQEFPDRAALRNHNIHLNIQAGIDGDKNGARSVILSGGYADDYDEGDEILYTGEGGNQNGRQIADQSWNSRGNKAMLISEMEGIPIRVTRGSKHISEYSPSQGYRYAGLYMITQHFEDTGVDGFRICRYRLNRISNTGIPIESSVQGSVSIPERSETTFLRIIRDSEKSRNIKKMYDYKCQICSLRIELKEIFFYAEGAHIKPLGKPHNGTDDKSNILCLCPNHHVMFDKGVFSIQPDYSLVGIEGKLNVDEKHQIDASNLEYHMNHIYGKWN